MSLHPKRDLRGLADQGVVSATTLFTTTIFIRATGLEEFGVLSLVWLVLLFVTAIQHAALVAPAYALLPKLEPEAARGFRGWLLLVQLGLLLLMSLILAGSWWAPGFSLLPRAPGLWPALFFLVARQSFSFLRLQLFTEASGPRRALPVDVLHGLLAVGFLAYLAWQNALDTRSGMLALGLAASLAALFAGQSFVRLGCCLSLPSRELRGRHLAVSKWLVGKSIAQWFTANSFLTALGTIQGPAALGAVRAAQTLIGVAGVVIQAFENLIPSRAALAFGAGDRAELCGFLVSSTRRWYAYLLVALLPLVCFPDFFLQLLTGRSEQGLREPMQLLACGAVLALGILSLQVFLRTLERVGIVFWAQLAAGLLGAVAAVPICTRFGIRGSLLGMLTQQLIVLLILLLAVRRQLRPQLESHA